MSGFLIDTNVISEFASLNPDVSVMKCLRARHPATLSASVITLGEIRLGIENLPPSKRRADLEVWLTAGLPEWFATNLLPVTANISDRWGRITIEAKRKGKRLATPDGLIAATAFEHGLTLVTRNVKDFADLSVPLFNPWVDGRA